MRSLCCLSNSAILSLSGFIIQNITENPLADSGTIGITSGASAGSVAFLLIADHFKLTGLWNFSYPIFALIGALLSFVLIYFFALRGGCMLKHTVQFYLHNITKEILC